MGIEPSTLHLIILFSLTQPNDIQCMQNDVFRYDFFEVNQNTEMSSVTKNPNTVTPQEDKTQSRIHLSLSDW